MGLLPDKPNPRIRSFAGPADGTRRCTKCTKRKPDDDFRWLNRNIRRSSRCKSCERAVDRAATVTVEPSLLDRILGTLPRPKAC